MELMWMRSSNGFWHLLNNDLGEVMVQDLANWIARWFIVPTMLFSLTLTFFSSWFGFFEPKHYVLALSECVVTHVAGLFLWLHIDRIKYGGIAKFLIIIYLFIGRFYVLDWLFPLPTQ